MTSPLIEGGPDGTVRMQISQGTRPAMGPIRIGVLATRTAEDPGGPSARVQISLHRDLGVASPGTVDLVPEHPLRIDGFGEIELIDVEPAEPEEGEGSQDPGTDLPPDPGGGPKDQVLIELRPL